MATKFDLPDGTVTDSAEPENRAATGTRGPRKLAARKIVFATGVAVNVLA